MQKKPALILFLFFLNLFFFLTKPLFQKKFASAQVNQNCVSTSNGSVCIELDVPGNTQSKSMKNYWPLVTDACWKMDGVSNKHGNGVNYKLQIKIEDPIIYEDQLVTPVDFVKNNKAGYWSPDSNLNLRWLVVDFDQSPESYMWAKGDKRYVRDSNPIIFSRRFRYDSLTEGHPPYLLMPQNLLENPENDGLVNSFVSRHQYYACSGSENCSLQPLNQHHSWFIGITNARIKAPFFGNEWIEAKRIEFVELSLPGKDDDHVTDPYSNDRHFACRLNGDVLYYRGVREDWYFVENVGPALILTRDIGKEPDEECVYEVVRENLTFENADTYTYLIQKDFDGYDPDWNYPTLTSPTPQPTPTPLPGDVNDDGQVNITDLLLVLKNWLSLPPDLVEADVNGDGKVNGVDFGYVAKILF